MFSEFLVLCMLTTNLKWFITVDKPVSINALKRFECTPVKIGPVCVGFPIQ